MDIRAYCRIPDIKNKSIKAKEGSCPELMYDLFSELDGAIEIHIGAYLFNNPTYYEFLSSLAQKGCKVKITSLPISGYNDKPSKVEGYNVKKSGREFAQNIYEKVSVTENMDLRIFPHLYMWYGALYVGGGASYSFHIKAIYAKFQNGKNKCILSSGNFMITDAYHSDNIIVIEDSPEYEKPFSKFFSDLESFSIPFTEFKNKFASYKEEFLYSFNGKEINLSGNEYQNCFFTAPFYFNESLGSNHYAGKRIIELISNAKNRVWICAQHFHDIVSFDTSRETIIRALYNKHHSNPSIEFRFLKQVPHSSLADKRRAAIAETLFEFVMQSMQKCNSLTHDKFMIIDDTLLVSTANYTSTQFAFGKRTMEFKDGSERIKKEDNFSEVNGFLIIPNCPEYVLNTYASHFMELWTSGQDIHINI